MKNRKIYIICCLVIVICLLAVGIRIGKEINNNADKEEVFINGIIPEKTETEIYLDSDAIIKGSVAQILDSKWSNPNFERGKDISNVLQTDIVVNVDEVYEGSISKNTVIVRINKGEDENTIVHSEGYPDFEAGEKVILFLSRDDSDVATDEDYYVLTGMKYGKYTLKENNNENILSENNVYINEKGQINPQNIKTKLNELKEANPNYKTEKEEKQKMITEKNKELFGE